MINFIFFALVMLHYRFIYIRERFLIDFLDEDNDKPMTYLKTCEKDYPEVLGGLYKNNRRVYLMSILVAIMFLVNGGLSGYVIFKFYNDTFRSATGWLTNLSLIASLLANSISISYGGMQEAQGLSLTHLEPTCTKPPILTWRGSINAHERSD